MCRTLAIAALMTICTICVHSQTTPLWATPEPSLAARIDLLQQRIRSAYIEEFEHLVNQTRNQQQQQPKFTKIVAFGGDKTLAILEIDPNRSKLNNNDNNNNNNKPNKRRNVNSIFVRDCVLFDTIKRNAEAAGFLRQVAQRGEAEYHPIYMDYMTLVDVNELCRLLDFERLRASAQQQQPQPLQSPNLMQMSFAQLIFSSMYDFRNFILPGTLWCGRGDKATSYWDVGALAEVDLCCREHDHCPVRLEAGETNYGVTNSKAITLSLCECEHRFRACLLSSNSEIGVKLSWIYFNLFQAGCLRQVDCANPHSHHNQQQQQQQQQEHPFAHWNENNNNKCNQLRFTISTDRRTVAV